jgi:hypothetical protein
MCPGCNNGIRDRGQKQQQCGSRKIEDLCGKLLLHFGNKKATNRIYWKTSGLEILKRSCRDIQRIENNNNKLDLVER